MPANAGLIFIEAQKAGDRRLSTLFLIKAEVFVSPTILLLYRSPFTIHDSLFTRRVLLDSYRLREVAWLIDVRAFKDRDVIRKQLHRNSVDNRFLDAFHVCRHV